jgi:hypothetical protein
VRIHIPYTDPRQTPSEALAANVDSALEDPEERRVAGELLLEAATDPDTPTMGALVQRIGEAGPAERRQLLDRLRRSAGLETPSEIEAEEHDRANRRAARALQQRIDQAPPEMQPTLHITPTGAFVEVDPVEVERDLRREEHLAAQHEERRREKERVAAEAEAAREALEERTRRETAWARR